MIINGESERTLNTLRENKFVLEDLRRGPEINPSLVGLFIVSSFLENEIFTSVNRD